MKHSTFFPIASVLYSIFGIGLLIVPQKFMLVYGINLDAGGQTMARILGAALLGFALLFARTSRMSFSKSIQQISLASFSYNLLDLPIVTMTIVDGTMNTVGWSAVALHVFLMVGFALVTFKPPALDK